MRQWLGVLAMGSVVAACTGGETSPMTVGSAAVLDGTSWTITSIDGVDLSAGEPRRDPFVAFDGESFSASAGCNNLRGSFEVAEGDVAFGSAASTMMACPPPLNEWEAKLQTALAEARTLERDGDILKLVSAAGNVLVEATASSR